MTMRGAGALLMASVAMVALSGCGEKAQTAGTEKRTDAKPWEGATGLEWTVPSPAPYHTFEEPPVLTEAKGHA